MTLRVPSPLRVARETMRERARNLDERRQWASRGLAQACGVSQSHLSRLETLHAKCTPAIAERIAAVFPRDVLTEIHLLYPERFMRDEDAPADAFDAAPRARRGRRMLPARRTPRALAPAGITVQEFCAMFRIQKWTFDRMRRDGKAPAFIRVGRRILILHDGLAAWMRGRQAATPSPDISASA